MKFGATFAGAGVTLAPAREEPEQWRMTLAAERYGCEGGLSPVGPATPVAESSHRFVYRRSELTEWYAHGPLGL